MKSPDTDEQLPEQVSYRRIYIYRKYKFKNAPFVRFTFNPYLSTVFFDKLFTQQQSKPGTRFSFCSFPPGLFIQKKQFAFQFLSHTNPGITDFYLNKIITFTISCHAYFSSDRSKFYCIGNEVPDNAIKHMVISKNL